MPSSATSSSVRTVRMNPPRRRRSRAGGALRCERRAGGAGVRLGRGARRLGDRLEPAPARGGLCPRKRRRGRGALELPGRVLAAGRRASRPSAPARCRAARPPARAPSPRRRRTGRRAPARARARPPARAGRGSPGRARAAAAGARRLLAGEVGQRGRVVGQPPGEQLVGDDAERVEVGRGAGGLTARLLRGEIRRRAQHGADLGDVGLLGRLGDAEVRELDLPPSRARSRLPGLTSRWTTPLRCA